MALTLDTKVSGDLVGVSTSPQANETTPATINKLLEFDETSTINIVREAQTNETEKTGEIEATDVDVLSRAAEGTLTQSRATSDGIAWALRAVFGAPTTTNPAAGVYQHVYKLLNYPDNPAYFTAAHRKGGSSTDDGSAGFRRHVGLAVGTLELRGARNDFLNLGIGFQGLGRADEGIKTETFTAVNFATPDVVLAQDPKGSSDAARATNIDVWVDVNDNGRFETQTTVATYVAGTNTATIDDLSGAITGTHDVRVSYEVDDQAVGFEWMDDLQNNAVLATDFKLKATNVRLYLNRKVDASIATPTATQGQFAGCELDDFVWNFNRNAVAGRCWRVNATTESEFAQQVELGDTIQRLTLNRKVRDYLIAQKFDANEEFGIEIDAYGPEISAGNPFEVHLLFHRCKILNRGSGVNERKWRDEVEIAVLKAAGTNQPSAAARIVNTVSSYA